MSDINITVNDEIVNIDIVDEPVLVNVVNSPGVPGAPGQGVPVGGTTGQVLAKNSATNYDTAWVNVSGGAWGTITGTLSNQTDLQTALDLKVPYTGATTNVNLGEYEIKAGQVTLDTSPTGTATVGTTRWNDTTGLTETTLKGGNVVLKNGVDLVARVVNKVTPNTTLTKAAYQAVRVSGAQGQRLAVAFAQANNDNNSADTIGLVIETIPTNQEGFIMTVGQIEGINTTGSLQGETWNDGDIIYLSPTVAGAVTNIKPSGGQHLVIIGYVEYAHANNGKLYIKISNGWELTELHDTDIVSPANNQGLFYESSSALWKNKSISTVLGYTPEQPLTFNSPLSRSVNAVSIPQATGSVSGFLSSTDWTTFNSKQNALGYTPANSATTLTINGVTYDLSANRSWTISAGISGSGASGQVAYWTGTSAQSGSNNLFWDATNSRLGIGTNVPDKKLHIKGDSTSSDIVFETTSYLTKGYFAHYQGATLQLAINRRIDGVFSNTSAASAVINVIALNNAGYINFFATNTNNSTPNEIMRINGTGNVLIQNGGTFTDSGERLQVTGTMKVTGDLTVSAGANMLFGTTLPSRQTGSATYPGIFVGNSNSSVMGETTTGFKGLLFNANAVRDLSLSTWVCQDTTKPAWKMGILYELDQMFVSRAAATSGALSEVVYFLINSSGNIALGNVTPTAQADISASTTARASLRIRSGVAPTSPNNGDIWFDGTDIKMRIGGVTKTFTLI